MKKYRELLKQHLKETGHEKIYLEIGLYLVGFADWLDDKDDPGNPSPLAADGDCTCLKPVPYCGGRLCLFCDGFLPYPPQVKEGRKCI